MDSIEHFIPELNFSLGPSAIIGNDTTADTGTGVPTLFLSWTNAYCGETVTDRPIFIMEHY
jgi:hypothetical protein